MEISVFNYYPIETKLEFSSKVEELKNQVEVESKPKGLKDEIKNEEELEEIEDEIPKLKYKCTFCNERFKRKDRLDRHIFIHTKEVKNHLIFFTFFLLNINNYRKKKFISEKIQM